MNAQTIKTDVLLALTFVAGALGDFGVTLSQTRQDAIANIVTAVISGVVTVTPVILATIREIKHLQAPVPLTTTVLPAPAPVAPPSDPAATQPAPVSAI